MQEIWRHIKGHTNYQISNMGRVKNKKKLLKLPSDSNGYLMVALGGSSFYVHRLVARAFVPNPRHLTIVNHKDEDKQNDQANNLEWCTRKYNNRYGSRDKKISRARFYSVKLVRGNFSKMFPSMKAANSWLRTSGGVKRSQCTIRFRLRRCCWGECQDVFGYRAEFVAQKGSAWQMSLFDQPRQMSLFGGS